MTRFVAELFASWVVTSDLTLLGLFGARPKQSRVGENGPTCSNRMLVEGNCIEGDIPKEKEKQLQHVSLTHICHICFF